MEIPELKVRRDSVLLAINKIENGAQEYRIGQRIVRRADLAALYAEYEKLDKKISSRERPSVTVAVLGRRH